MSRSSLRIMRQVRCPNCGKLSGVVSEGKIRCTTSNFSVSCGYHDYYGAAGEKLKESDQTIYDANVRRENRRKREIEEAKKEEARAQERRAKEQERRERERERWRKRISDNPSLRLGEYLETEVRKHYQEDDESGWERENIYFIELEKPRFLTSCTFPNGNYPILSDYDCAGYICIKSCTGDPEEDFLKLSTRKFPINTGGMGVVGTQNAPSLAERIIMKHGQKASKSLTDNYGFRNIPGGYGDNTRRLLMNWLGWALYNVGYWVWVDAEPAFRHINKEFYL